MPQRSSDRPLTVEDPGSTIRPIWITETVEAEPVELEELVVRVEKLERENRRLKFAGGAVVAVLLAVALVGAVMPQDIPEVVEARSFRLVDGFGQARAILGEGRSSEGAPTGDSGFALFDARGNKQIDLVGGKGVFVFGEGAAVLTNRNLVFEDEGGVPRSQLGRVALTTPATGAETTYPAAVVLYDAESNVIWRAPR